MTFALLVGKAKHLTTTIKVQPFLIVILDMFFVNVGNGYCTTFLHNDYPALGKQLARYKSFVILSCLENDHVRAVTI